MRIHMQSGQAVVEGLIVLGVLSSLWVGVAWLGRTQDVALQVGHASRHQAFALAHQGQAPEAFETGYLIFPGQSWQTRRGTAFLDTEGPQTSWMRELREPLVRIGEASPAAAAVRRDLQLEDHGVWVASAHRQTTGVRRPGTGLGDFDRHRLGISRHTAIMRGSGAVESDHAVQERIARADSIWARQAGRSIDLGVRTSGRVRATDEAWGRPDFMSDWLTPWTGWVPAQHLGVRKSP